MQGGGTKHTEALTVQSSSAGTMNGCEALAREVEEGVRRLTDRTELGRLSFPALVELFGFSDLQLLSRRRRCSGCWKDDGDEPCERKVDR